MAKKSVTKKAATKTAVPTKKVAVKKTAAPAPAATPAPVKKAVAKKTATKKAAVKKAPAKKVVAKAPAEVAPKPAAVTTPTTVVATIDVGFGNTLYIRGDGPGLSWDRGIMMDCQADDRWEWSTYEAKAPFMFKVLINDEIWAEGTDNTALPGKQNGLSPTFG